MLLDLRNAAQRLIDERNQYIRDHLGGRGRRHTVPTEPVRQVYEAEPEFIVSVHTDAVTEKEIEVSFTAEREFTVGTEIQHRARRPYIEEDLFLMDYL